MKRLITLLFIFATLTISNAQYVESVGRYFTVTIADTTAEDTVYIVRNYAGQIDIDTTMTTYSDIVATRTTPPSGIFLEPNAGTGMAAGETDSLAIIVYPIMYDWIDGKYVAIWSDGMYLSFGQRSTALKGETWLDWTSGAEYYCPLIDSLGVPLFNASTVGIAVEVKQVNDQTGTGLYTVLPVWKLNNK